MNDQKLSRLIELMVAKEVKKQLPKLLSEMVEPQARVQPMKKVSSNPLLNELITSARDRQPVYDDFESRLPKPGNKPLTNEQLVNTMRTNPEAASINPSKESVKNVMDIINRKYNVAAPTKKSLTRQVEEDLSEYDKY